MRISLKQLSVQQKKVLIHLIEELKKIKEAKENQLRQRQKSKSQKRSIGQSRKAQQQKNQSKSIIRACQANEYIKMVYLMLRQGVYGIFNQKGLSFKIIEQHLSLYKDTYIFKYQLQNLSSKSTCKSKLLIFQSITQQQLSYYYVNKHLIKSIQILAEKVHQEIETYIRKYCVQNKSDSKLQLRQHQKNIIQPLREVISLIEQHYPWERWMDSQMWENKKKSDSMVRMIRKESIKLSGLNFKAVNFLANVQKYLHQLSRSLLFGNTVNKVFKEMRDQRKQKMKEEQMREQQQNRSEQICMTNNQQQSATGNKIQQHQQIQSLQTRKSKQKYPHQSQTVRQQPAQLLIQRQQYQQQYESTSISTTSKTTGNDRNTNQQLISFCLQLQTLQQQKSAIQKLYLQQKLKQQLFSFNYYYGYDLQLGQLDSHQLGQLNSSVSTKIKSQQLREYNVRKQLGDLLFKHFYNIYSKYNQQSQQQHNQTRQP